MKEWEPRQKVLNNNDKEPEATLWVATHFTGKPEVILYLGKQKKSPYKNLFLKKIISR